MIAWPNGDGLLEEWNNLFDALHSDVVRLEELINVDDCGCWRRSYCRSIFSLMDAMTSQMNRETLHWNYPALLGDDGKRELERRGGILSNVYSALDLYTNTWGADTPLIKGSKEWLAIQDAVKIRNRVTHPKLPEDIEISDADLCRLKLVKEIFSSLVTTSIANSATALLKRAEALKNIKIPT